MHTCTLYCIHTTHMAAYAHYTVRTFISILPLGPSKERRKPLCWLRTVSPIDSLVLRCPRLGEPTIQLSQKAKLILVFQASKGSSSNTFKVI